MKLASKLTNKIEEATFEKHGSSEFIYLETSNAGFSINSTSVNEFNKEYDEESYFPAAEIGWAGPSTRIQLVDKGNKFNKDKEARLESEKLKEEVSRAVKSAADNFDKEIKAFASKMGLQFIDMNKKR